MSSTIDTMKRATEQDLDRASALLQTLGTKHGLSGFRHAGDGRLVADIAPGRTYFDVAELELELGDYLGVDVEVILSGTPESDALATRPVQVTPAA